jgi:hypothetical protein
MRRWICCGLFLTWGLMGCAKSKTAATPEEALTDFAEAAHVGDVRAVLDTLAETPRGELRGLLLEVEEVSKAQDRYESALAAKFGNPPNTMPKVQDRLKRWLRDNFAAIEVLGREVRGENQVQLKIRITTRAADGKETKREETIDTLREGGGWKWVPPSSYMTQVALMKGLLENVKGTLEQTTQEVKAGKCLSPEEANQKLLLLHVLAG